MNSRSCSFFLQLCQCRCIAQGPRKHSVECKAVWMSGSRESFKHWRPGNRPAPKRHILNRRCTSSFEMAQHTVAQFVPDMLFKDDVPCTPLLSSNIGTLAFSRRGSAAQTVFNISVCNHHIILPQSPRAAESVGDLLSDQFS